MAQEYTVKRVSSKPPKEVDGAYGKVYYITVQLEDHDKFVQIGKKSPDSIKPGDTLYGHIEETDFPTDKFKSERKPNQGFGNKDNSEIKAQMAIKAAVQLLQGHTQDLDTVESVAKDIYKMVERVKG